VHRRFLAVVPVAAFLLVLLIALPALGQGNVQYDAACQNIIGSFNAIQLQVSVADANATGGDAAEGNGGGDAEAVAEVAQEAGVSVAQVNECLNAAGEKTGVKAAANAAKAQYAKADVIPATIPKKPLPFTGGMPLLGLAALGIAAIVAGVFVLRAVMSHRL
jgi:hypothetical protein